RVCQSGKIHPTNALYVLVSEFRRHAKSQARLAASASSYQAHQMCGRQQLRNFCDLALAPDKTGKYSRKVWVQRYLRPSAVICSIHKAVPEPPRLTGGYGIQEVDLCVGLELREHYYKV
ncbi:MAG: hypothetical protein AAB382_00490, partial [Chloroflexota bacterium]